MKKDKILMSGMSFYGYHGVLDAEKELGQKFFVDATLYLDFQEAGKTDDLNLSVSYADVYAVIKKVVEEERYDLLEALAENIANRVLDAFNKIDSIKVKIKKPEAPVAGIFDYFGVEIKRKRA